MRTGNLPGMWGQLVDKAQIPRVGWQISIREPSPRSDLRFHLPEPLGSVYETEYVTKHTLSLATDKGQRHVACRSRRMPSQARPWPGLGKQRLLCWAVHARGTLLVRRPLERSGIDSDCSITYLRVHNPKL